MNLRYITCSDPREYNDFYDIANLAQLSPRVEIAVQAHPSKMSRGMPRNEWFYEFLQYVLREKYDINLAVHVNLEWCDEICRTGKIPADLKRFFDLRREYYSPVIKRWQLNIPADTVPNVNVRALTQLFDACITRNFIIQYNARTSDLAKQLYANKARFSTLLDESGGCGVDQTNWSAAPVFVGVPQGFSGGLSPENVKDNLTKIFSIEHSWAYDDVWIDAEGKLKTDKKFDVARAHQYVLNAESWWAKQRQK